MPAPKKAPANLAAFAKDREVWEQQPDETPVAFDAFRAYCVAPYRKLLPDGRPDMRARSLGLVAEDLGKSHQHMKQWSAAWHWRARAVEYDADQRGQEREALREAERHAAHVVAGRRLDAREKAWELAEELRHKVVEMLRFSLYDETTEKREVDELGTVEVVVRKPVEGWGPGTIATLARAYAALALVATDDGSRYLDGLLARIDTNDLTDDQLTALENGANVIDVLLGSRKLAPAGEGDADEA